MKCAADNPPRLIQHNLELIRGTKVIHQTIYGWWNETTQTYAWHGPRLIKITQSTLNRRMLPSDSVSVGCIRGVS